MITKVVTIRDVEEIPYGTVFDAELEIEDGIEYWTGVWCSIWGSYVISVPRDACEEYDSHVHASQFDRVMAAHWKKKYADDAAQDKPGELPKLFLEHSIRDLKERIDDFRSFSSNQELAHERDKTWLKSLEDYYARVYG